MTHVIGRTMLAAVLPATLFYAACKDSTGPVTRTFRGPEVAVGAGFARTELVFDESDRVRSVSVVFSESALTDLPATLPNTEYVLPMPDDAPSTVFDHAGINWQPQGHPPPMVYTHPHFDVHFYLVSVQERNAMTPADPAFAAKAVRAPVADEAPPSYVADPFGIPRMGTHWTDQTSHEFHGQPFTHTMVYGFYDGEMIFLEPMMTKAFLESRPNEVKRLRVPARYPRPGDYPAEYSVTYDAAAGEYRVELNDFAARN